jgi:hypothetical protein
MTDTGDFGDGGAHDTPGSGSGGDAPAGEGGGRRGALIALIVIAIIVIGGIWLSQSLRGTGRIQDCVMSGRTNCAPVQ